MIKKQTIKGLFTGFLVVLLGLIYWVFLQPSILVAGTSPSGKNEVIIKEYGNGLIQGGNVKFFFKTDGKTVKTKKVRVENIRESNHSRRFSFYWENADEVSVEMNFESLGKSLTYNFSNSNIEIKENKE